MQSSKLHSAFASGKRLAIIDFELVFDVWSLLFCCIRCERQALKNEHYEHLLYRPVRQAIGDSLKALSSQSSRAIGEEGKIDEEVSAVEEKVLRHFEQNLISVKPWIPCYQLVHALEQADYRVLLRPSVEAEYYQPLLSRLDKSQVFKSIFADASNKWPELIDSQRADLVITGDLEYSRKFDEARKVHLVRPRKLKIYDGLDITEIGQLRFDSTSGEPSSETDRQESVDSKLEGAINFCPVESRKFISLDSLSDELTQLPELVHWDSSTHVAMKPLQLEGTVVKGFGRGSKQLGVPTANIDMTAENKEKTHDLVPGVYAAEATLKGKSYRCAMSIGWNPVYDNTEKTIEAFLINNFHRDDYDFYGAHLQLSVIAFIRAESLFSDFDSLIHAIQCDIHSVVNSKLFS